MAICKCVTAAPSIPAASAKYRAAPPAAAANRASASICKRMRFGSVATGVGKRNIACFAAIWAVVQAISAEAYGMLAFADGAIFLAGAAFLGLVTHSAAHSRTGHGTPPTKTLTEAGEMRQGARVNDAASYALACVSG